MPLYKEKSLIMYDENRNLVASTIMHVVLGTVAGGNGQTSNFLTTDGLTKSGSNSFLFSSVKSVMAACNSIQTLPEGPSLHGWSYDSGTGALVCQFLESKTTGVLIGGTVEGLEAEENGTVMKITIVGV